MERYLDVEGARLWTTCNGEGTSVIFCNGGPGCDDYLGPVSALIEDRCKVVRFEPRGCGRSDYDGRYDVDTTIADIEHIARAYNFDRFILLGHSAGPDIALAYTIRWPERVMGIIGIAGGRIVDDRNWHETYRTNRDTIGDQLPQEFIADPAVNRIGNESWKAYIKRPDLLQDIAALECPAVFINAGRDIRPNWPTRQLAGLLPYGHYREIADARHCPWLTHPAELQARLREALDLIVGHA